MWRKQNAYAPLVGMQTGAATLENSIEVPQKVKNRIMIWSSNSTMDVYPVSKKANPEMCTPMFIVALFAIAKKWKQILFWLKGLKANLFGIIRKFMLGFFFKLLMFCLFLEREKEWASEWGQAERGRQMIWSRLHAMSAEPMQGSNPWTGWSGPEPKSRIGRLTYWATQAPCRFGSEG